MKLIKNSPLSHPCCVYYSHFTVHKKYSCRFITLRLNHCSLMDYFNNVFTTFLGFESGINVAVYGGSESTLDLNVMNKKIL